jgi:hypothetical protein
MQYFHTSFTDTAHVQYIHILAKDVVHSYQIIEEREKSYLLSCASRGMLYRGRERFWMPKFGLRKSSAYINVKEISAPYFAVMERENKIDLNVWF